MYIECIISFLLLNNLLHTNEIWLEQALRMRSGVQDWYSGLEQLENVPSDRGEGVKEIRNQRCGKVRRDGRMDLMVCIIQFGFDKDQVWEEKQQAAANISK